MNVMKEGSVDVTSYKTDRSEHEVLSVNSENVYVFVPELTV